MATSGRSNGSGSQEKGVQSDSEFCDDRSYTVFETGTHLEWVTGPTSDNPLTSEDWSVKLLDASSETEARRFLRKGVIPTHKNSFGGTALHRAAWMGWPYVVESLLRQQMALDLTNFEPGDECMVKDKRTGTDRWEKAVVASTGVVPVIGVTLEREPNTIISVPEQIRGLGFVDGKTNHSAWTALHAAANYGQWAVVEVLLANGASVMAAENKNWYSPLITALGRYNEKLTQKGKSNEKQTLEDRAYEKNLNKTIKMFLADKNSINENLTFRVKGKDHTANAMFYAIIVGDIEILQLFLDLKAEIPSDWGRMKIVRNGVAIKNMLIKAGAPVKHSWQKAEPAREDTAEEDSLTEFLEDPESPTLSLEPPESPDRLVLNPPDDEDHINRRRRLIAQTPEQPLVECDKLSSTVIETPAIAESSHVVPAMLFALALLIGYLFFRCVKARRTKPRPLAYPRGLLGGEAEAEPARRFCFNP